MLDLDAGVILFKETNFDWKDYELKGDYNHRIMQHWPTNRTQLSISKATADKDYLLGGTAITILGKRISRILQSTEDPINMGRWSAVQLWGKQQEIYCSSAHTTFYKTHFYAHKQLTPNNTK